jgi:hypothetical protein
MTQMFPSITRGQNTLNQPANSITAGYGLEVTDPSRYAQSNTARNLALAGTGLQAVGSIGQAIYGGRQQRRQAEENRRAIGKANLISILSGGSVTPAPEFISSRGSQISQVLSGVGGSLNSLGNQLQKLRESELTLRMAEDAAFAKRRQDARAEEQHKIIMRDEKRREAVDKAARVAVKAKNAIAKKYNFATLMQNPGSAIHAEVDLLQGQTGAHAQLISREATQEAIAPLFKDAIARIESNFDYGEVGPEIMSGLYKGDHAYGKYQVMGKNIPDWSKEILGYEVSPEEFLNNKDLQEDIAGAKLDQYLKERILKNPSDPETAIKEAAVMWFGGRGNLKHFQSKSKGDQQVDSEGNVTFEGKSNFEYTNEVYNYISEASALTLGYGDVENRFSDAFTVKRLEKKAILDQFMSPEFRQEVLESSNVSPEMKDAFLGTLDTQTALFAAEIDAEKDTIMQHFQSQMRNMQDTRRQAASMIDSRAAAHARTVQATEEQKQKAIKLQIDISNDWHNAWAKNPVYKDYKEFLVAWTKLNQLGKKLYDPVTGEKLTRDSPEYKQFTEELSKGVFDVTLINTYQRLIDPATVKEGDVELYRNNTSGKLGSIYVALQNIRDGGAVLTPETLTSMLEISNDLKRGMDRALAYETLSFVEAKEKSFAGMKYPELVSHIEDELFTKFNIEARNYVKEQTNAGAMDEDSMVYITRDNLDSRYGSSSDYRTTEKNDRSSVVTEEYEREYKNAANGAPPGGSARDSALQALNPTSVDTSFSAGALGTSTVFQGIPALNDAFTQASRGAVSSAFRGLADWIRPEEEQYPQAAVWRR